MISERNYLDVYPYDKWTGNRLPNFEVGHTFVPDICELRDGKTTKPNYLTEADLVTLMDKNGIGAFPISLLLVLLPICMYALKIGTDATIAQHIDTIIKREYVIERQEGATKYLLPSTLGIGLVVGYDKIGLEKSLTKPYLRREVRVLPLPV